MAARDLAERSNRATAIAVRAAPQRRSPVHPPAVRAEAQRLLAAGSTAVQVAAQLGVPRRTVAEWSRPTRPELLCPRCWSPTRPITASAEDDAELLGLYLGDGHITATPRTHRLRISLDAKYTHIIDESEALLTRCLPAGSVQRVRADAGATVVLSTYHRHLPCLLPQHGPGRKHERLLVFEPWQLELVATAPWSFLRGCIRSDGCVFVNWTGRFEYVSYHFSNRSTEILWLFTEVCRRVGLSPRPAGVYVRLNRRDDVARLLEHVGIKA